MILDTSALLAILRDEPEAAAYAQAIEAAAKRRMSAGTLLETAILIDASGDPLASRKLDELIRVAGIEIEPATAEHIRLGRQAYSDFGKGSGHSAQLNFGDCLAYALAIAADEPLLYKGTAFGQTDVRSVFADGGR